MMGDRAWLSTSAYCPDGWPHHVVYPAEGDSSERVIGLCTRCGAGRQALAQIPAMKVQEYYKRWHYGLNVDQ